MKTTSTSRRGFTLLELLVVISIIVILALVLFPVFTMIRNKMRENLAKQTMNTLIMALEDYRNEFKAFPPDDTPTNNGSEMIWYYLCRVHKVGERTVGPYVKIGDGQLTEAPSGGYRKFLSPLGGEYEYGVLIDTDGKKRQFMLIDPGKDKKPGGSITPSAGFTVSNEKEAKDNIDNFIQPTTK